MPFSKAPIRQVSENLLAVFKVARLSEGEKNVRCFQTDKLN